MAKEMLNKYYVVDESKCNIFGIRFTRKQIKKCKVIYEGIDPKKANETQRRYNLGKHKFAPNRASIFVGGKYFKDRIVMYKY